MDRRRVTRALGAAALGTAAMGPGAALGAAYRPGRIRLPPAYLADFDGDGRVGPADERTLRAAVGSRRGLEVRPATGYDPRADFFARLRVGEQDLKSLRMLRQQGPPMGRRPVTIAWHYGWYHARGRPQATAEFLGGRYLSSDPDVEGEFNRLRNEFGVSVDALSWVSSRVDDRTPRAFRRGYLRASKLSSRCTCLLYESTINLGDGANRISFVPQSTRADLVNDFEEMARFLVLTRDTSPARLFLIGGRPVIFLYASHTWGWLELMPMELQLVDEVMGAARSAFERIFGVPPYLVGEEMLLSASDQFSEDRRRRSRNFDALFVYHHASSPEHLDGLRIGAHYAQQPLELFAKTLERAGDIVNRFTGEVPRLIPSLAAGFAKKGWPRLWASRAGYLEFLATVDEYMERNYLAASEDRLDPGLLPVYTVGSWNEEFEGHALFPARFNRSIKRLRYGGFDLPLALKEHFGWNTYSRRPIEVDR